MKTIKNIAIALLLAFAPGVAHSQCGTKNTAFGSGEYLSYNLYYNWKFVWVKAGTASMYTVATTYKGHRGYKSSLITRGSTRADKFFVLRDTLLCYTTNDLSPLYYRKGAHEGKRYYVDELFYTYGGTGVNVKQHQLKANGKSTWKNHHSKICVYDMMSIFLRARSYDAASWRKGYTIAVPLADGDKTINARLRYNGKVNVKADNGHTYRTLSLSYIENEDGDWKEIVRFYVTDDTNHIPVRLDLFLKFGTAKAFLSSYKGVRSPITSLVK